MRSCQWLLKLMKLFLKDNAVLPSAQQRPQPLSAGRPLCPLGGGWWLETQQGTTYVISPNRRHYWFLTPIGLYDPLTESN